MNILLINELYEMGGTEVQTKREKKYLESIGHKVLYITFDSKLPHGVDFDDGTHYNFSVNYTRLERKLYEFVIDRKLYHELTSLIEKFAPDSIHINNMTVYAITVFHALKGRKCIQTIRDYSAVCPTGLCVDKESRVCEGLKYNNCINRCLPSHAGLKTKISFQLNYYRTLYLKYLRKKCIVNFSCPSQQLTDYCNKHDLKTECINNPFDFSILDNFKKNINSEKKIYLFYGLVAKHKGIFQLINAFKEFSNSKNVELHIIGALDSQIENEFMCAIKKSSKILYLGKKNYEEIFEELALVYSVVVPSVWMENYPNTALEGLVTECIVIGSNRGGIPELVNNNNLIFDVMDKTDIIRKLEYSYNLSNDEYKKIIQHNHRRIRTNNSIDVYYERMSRYF